MLCDYDGIPQSPTSSHWPRLKQTGLPKIFLYSLQHHAPGGVHFASLATSVLDSVVTGRPWSLTTTTKRLRGPYQLHQWLNTRLRKNLGAKRRHFGNGDKIAYRPWETSKSVRELALFRYSVLRIRIRLRPRRRDPISSELAPLGYR